MDAKTKQTHFMYLLERIGQPLYISPRGQGKTQVLYNVPPDILEEYEAQVMVDLRKKIPPGANIDIINITKTRTPYDLTPVLVVPRNGFFSYLSPTHRDAADALVKIFMDQPDEIEFFNACAACRDKVNPHLWLQAMLTAVLHRDDMRGFAVPNLWEIVPDLFFKSNFIKEVEKQAAFPKESRAVIEVPFDFTGFDSEPEHKVAYFREDIALSSFHFHFHLAYPYTAPKGTMDRKGELFYSLHHELIARYNTERLTNKMNRVVPYKIQNANEPIKEPYFPHLTLINSGKQWGGRQPNTIPKDIDHLKDPTCPLKIATNDLRIWQDRITEAIDAGFALSSDSKKVNLRDNQGIDKVVAMTESSKDSVYPLYYGNLHNFGHIILTFPNDPNYTLKDGPGVMLSIMVSARDPVFWRWHYNLETVFLRQKEKLPHYTADELSLKGIEISNVEIHTPSIDTNSLLTFWMQSDVDLSRGLDFFRTDDLNLGPIYARLTHLQHRDFYYQIKVNNTRTLNVNGCVRIFMAPQLDEAGVKFAFSEQRKIFFMMDKFSTILRPGENVIRRNSTESSLTIPWGQSFSKLERDDGTNFGNLELFCGCGLPQHLLVPKGRHEGTPFDLFVMISDWDADRVQEPNVLSDTEKVGCKDAVDFCGVINRKFPDSKPLGYPLDRNIAGDRITGESNTINLQTSLVGEFVKPFSNMKTIEVKIFHRDVTVVREGGAPADSRVIKA